MMTVDAALLRLECAILGAAELAVRLHPLIASGQGGAAVALDAVRRHLEAAATEAAAVRRGLSGTR